MEKVALHNLGCKVNAYETEGMQQLLEQAGYEIVPFEDKADIYIVNTCSVTNIADRKSRQMLHRAKKQNPEALVVAVGCYVQTAEAELREDAAVDLLIGNNRKKDLLAILKAYEEGVDEETVIDINHTKEYENMTVTKTAEHTRAYVKVQDGCNQFCSYCVIPYARGRVRSRESADVCAEIRELAAAGYREVVLTGIHLSSYGVDLEGENLLTLIQAVNEIDGIDRIRLGSLEPRIITEEFAEMLAKMPKFCPHFHLSLQSGCDATLARMKRRYTTERYLESVELLRRHFDRPALTTDLIVGFPGETEGEFAQTLSFLQTCAFAQMHIFPYSVRPGTPAAKMRQVPKAVKEERARQAAAVAEALHRNYLAACVGAVYPVLFEQPKDGRYFGHAPNYMEVLADGTDLHNQVRNVKVTGTDGASLLGELLED